MRKGQKVRLLKDNSIVVITDSTFFKLDGQKRIRYQVMSPRNKHTCWYPAEELAPVTEQVNVTMCSDNGRELRASLVFNHDKQKLNVKLTGNPENLKDHHGLHARFMATFIEGLAAGNQIINREVQSKPIDHE